MKISLALSGGGFRATVFHLGVLARLAREDFIEELFYFPLCLVAACAQD
jgi:NTE family protein